MKIVPNRILSVLTLVLSSAYAFAGPTGPPPPQGVPPPGLPIDGSVEILFCIAIFFGIYKIYQLKIKTKAPI